jgi:2,4-dienoyl-CoA reductase (NADPH2)
VIGSGPAGLSASTVAAECGHDVTLFDSSDSIGGQFKIAMQVPGKEEFSETLRYFARQIEVTGVKLRLNQRVTREQLLAQGFDEIIVATGITPRVPPIEGINHPKVLSYIDVLLHKKSVGEKVAIIGAGGIGFDVAEYLIHDPRISLPISVEHWCEDWGVDLQANVHGGLAQNLTPPKPFRHIHLLQRKTSKVGAGLGKTSGWVHRAALQRGGVVMMAGVEYNKIDDAGLHITVNGVAKILDVDNVILCAGQDSLAELMPQQTNDKTAKTAGPRFHKIGGAKLAAELDAKRAIREGAELAASL